MSATEAPSTYLDFLPIIFQERSEAAPGEPAGANYVGLLLRAFEEILSGGGVDGHPSLNGAIDRLPELFTPALAPPEFLDWLSGWVALVHRADLPTDARRRLLAGAVSLYRWRGTRRGLADAIRLYTGLEPDIREPGPDLRIGDTTVVGEGRIGGGLPHTFEVRVRITDVTDDGGDATPLAERARRDHDVLRDLIESQKPAHTLCTLVVEVPTMQIGVRSTVGADTLLGSAFA